SRNRFGGDADHHAWRHSRHDVGISGLPDSGDPAVLDADIGLEDAGPVDHEGIRDQAVERLVFARTGCLAHAVSQDFASAEPTLVTVNGIIALHLRDEARVTQPHAIAGGRAEHRRVVAAIDRVAHDASPSAADSTWPNPRPATSAAARLRLASLSSP